jgi:hypothetical protein
MDSILSNQGAAWRWFTNLAIAESETPNVEKHKVFVIVTIHLVCHHFALPAARRLRISLAGSHAWLRISDF